MATDSQQAAASAALTAIESGDWDRFLLRLRAAIEQRRQTPEYQRTLIAGAGETIAAARRAAQRDDR